MSVRGSTPVGFSGEIGANSLSNSNKAGDGITNILS
jgi:hypothetical protein